MADPIEVVKMHQDAHLGVKDAETNREAMEVDVEFAVFMSDVAALQAECVRRRTVLEVDSSGSGVKTLETVRWAVAVLLQMETQERKLSKLELEDWFVAQQAFVHLGGQDLDTNSARAESAIENNAKSKLDERSIAEDDEDAEVDFTGSEKMLRSPTQLHGMPEQDDIRARESLKEPGGNVLGKQVGKGDRNDPVCESGMHEREVESLERVVKEADNGKAGTHMAELVRARMVRPQCDAMMSLITYCLIKGLDQHSPFTGFVGDMHSAECEGVTTDTNVKNYDGVQSIWLHKWLVKEVMQSNSTHRSPLDWLVAHLTATSPSSFLRPVLDDLLENVAMCNAKHLRSLSTYVRRIVVLEYAALRDPKQVATNLQLLFSNRGFLGSILDEKEENNLRSSHKQILTELWSVWLVTATLCPKFLAACTCYWIPLLSVKTFESCGNLLVSMVDVGDPLTSLWALLEGVTRQEPRRISAWLSAILSRRISELAPVGADLVLLLNRLIHPSNKDRLEPEILEVATCLLQRLHMDLTIGVLHRAIGAEHIMGAEPLSTIPKHNPTGILAFVDNLTSNVNKLWAELLGACLMSTSDGYEGALSRNSGLENSVGKRMKVVGDEPGISNVQALPNARGRGWWSGDPFIGVCRISVLCSGHYAVAELLAEGTVVTRSDSEDLDEKSVMRLLYVMEVMKMVAGQGRGAPVIEMWSQLCLASLSKCSDEKALQRVMAIQQLLDPLFWQSHQRLLAPACMIGLSIQLKEGEELKEDFKGLSWKVVWTLLRKVVESQWLHLVPLLHRKSFSELHLVVLSVFQALSHGSDYRPQAVVVQLKGLLGFFFQLLDEPFGKKAVGESRETGGRQMKKWESVQVLEHLKRVIVLQASSSCASFTVMVSSMLDYSFERSGRKAEASSLLDNDTRIQKRGLGANGRGSFSTTTLVPGRLDQSGNFTLLSVPAGRDQICSVSPKFSLTEENRRMKAGGLSSLGSHKRERLGSSFRNGDDRRPVDNFAKESLSEGSADITMMELRDLLRRTMGCAVSQAAEKPDIWSPHPAYILASQMIDRLETPHELAMTMEQYEEVLPKQVSSPRHIFLADCFGHNQLLFEQPWAGSLWTLHKKLRGCVTPQAEDPHVPRMLDLIVKHRRNDEVISCVEFIRVLLADNISRWHIAYRTRRDPALPPPRVFGEERLDRMQVIRLINLVADAGWLPQPLATTIEILEIIDAADVADLLLLVWRCMHHAMAFGIKSCHGVSEHVTSQSVVSSEKIQQMQGAEGDGTKGGTYTEWEGHLFAILRQNISKIGAHFAQVYPKRDTL